MEDANVETIIEKILSGGVAEFSYHGETYLIQEENNKGWNYLCLWRIVPNYACISRVFFDILDGVSEETVQELLDQPFSDELAVREVLQSPETEWK